MLRICNMAVKSPLRKRVVFAMRSLRDRHAPHLLAIR